MMLSRSKPQTNLGCPFLARGVGVGGRELKRQQNGEKKKKKHSQCDIGHFLCTINLYAQSIFKPKFPLLKLSVKLGMAA